MASLESGLKQLVQKLTGKPIDEIPKSLEGIVDFAAGNLELSGGGQGSPGTDGKDGVGVASITLETDTDGAVIGGKWKDTNGEDHTITIE